MIRRRSLAQLLRLRQTSACISSCKVSFDSNTFPPTRPTSYYFASQLFIHSSSATLYNNNRHSNNERHGGGERKWGRNSNSNKQRYNADKSGELSPIYISHLEQRAREHIRNFPINITASSSNKNAYTDDVATLLSPWNRTTIELTMLMSKMWGRKNHNNSNHQHKRLDNRMQMYKLVSLSNELLDKVLSMKKLEVGSLLEKHNIDTTISGNRQKERGRAKFRDEYLSTEILCQSVALGWSRCDPNIAPNAAVNAQSVLESLEDICTKRELLQGVSKVSFDMQDVTPSIKLYNHVLTCWSRSLDLDAELHAKILLKRMIECEPGTFSYPDKYSYNNMLNLYANKGDVNAAEALLQEMEESNDVSVDVYSYSIMMNAFQKKFTSSGRNNRDMKDPERAEELLSRLVAKYEKSGFTDDRLRPTSVTFGTVIAMYAQADRILKDDNRLDYGKRTRKWRTQNVALNIDNKNVGWGAKNAERVLEWMIGLNERQRERQGKDATSDNISNDPAHSSSNKLIRPSTHNFATVMDAWAKAGKGVEGAQNCERLLDRLIELYDKLGYNELQPNPICFGTVIDAWSKADIEYETAEKAELLLNRMEELFLHRKSSNPREMLSNIAYNLVIDAWSRRPGNDAADRAENILRRLVKNYELTKNRFLRPDVISYTAVMKACVNHPNGGEKAVQILEEMKAQYKDGNVRAKPDVKALSVAMDACAKSGLTEEAELMLNDIDDSQKSNIQFNTIMSGYKSEGHGCKAEALLRRMISLEKSGFQRCSPDRISYTLCIEAWGHGKHDDRVLRAKALLDESIKRYQSGDISCRPSEVTFNATASCIANSADPERYREVLALFEKMEGTEGCNPPNQVSFNTLITTCATVTGSEERCRDALQIAASAFNSLPSSTGIKANEITYSGMIRALLNLMENSDERTKAIAGIFQQCCKDGFLNQQLVDILAQATTEDQYLFITGVSKTAPIDALSNLHY